MAIDKDQKGRKKPPKLTPQQVAEIHERLEAERLWRAKQRKAEQAAKKKKDDKGS